MNFVYTEIKAVAPELLDLLPLLLPNIQYDRNDNPPEEHVSFTDQLHLYFSANSGYLNVYVSNSHDDFKSTDLSFLNILIFSKYDLKCQCDMELNR